MAEILEKGCRWHFAKHLGGREDGPNDPMQENFKKTPYASLIRESIQNSLDVPLDTDSPVRMEYSISRIRPKDYRNFFDLQQHMEGCINHFRGNNDAKTIYQPMVDNLKSLKSAIGEEQNLYYIKVSDYNTLGMNYERGDTNQPFYAFVRAAGVSSKSDSTAGGSFGYGKAAYFYISPLRTIFVSTQTKDNKHFFEGVSSLCTHQVSGEDELRVSVGYYDNNDGYPITDVNNIPERFKRTESGTDIYIMGIDASDKGSIYNEMIEAVLRNFWMAIESKKLVVKIHETEINFDTLPILMEQYFPEVHDSARREKNYNPKPYWDAVHNAGIDAKHIKIEQKLPVIGHVKFYALKSKNAADKILYMRRPLMLVKARRTQSSNGFYGVFICDDLKGNEYLRETENPAHDEWKSANWRYNGKIVSKGREAIEDVDSFIVSVMGELFSNRENTIQQIQGLEDFLYIPTAVDEDFEDDYENESLLGEVVEIQENETNSITTELSEPTISPSIDKPSIGKIILSNSKKTNLTKNTNGGHLSGHGTKPKKKKGGGGLGGTNIEGRFEEQEDGVHGSTMKEIPVRYRTFAQVENGIIVHNIVIHSDCDFENGRIDLIVGGEQTDEKVSIKNCFGAGEVNQNSIYGLKIHKGKNTLKIKFEDNMKHAIKLDAYECK
jgi:hypothetical protein